MKILLLQIDGKIPNLALMRISAFHKANGDVVELRYAGNQESVRRNIWDSHDKIYASLIFEKSRPIAETLLVECPHTIIGGTGWDIKLNLADVGITEKAVDYTIYPHFNQSIGYTQRGCRLACSFCVVPRKEGKVREESTIKDIWRGGNFPKEILLLDNDFFGQLNWRERIDEIKDGEFKVSFNQGINARFLTDETASAIASVDYRDDQMKDKRIYTAWDNQKDEDILFRGLQRLVDNGIKPVHIMVYMLIGYWPKETHADRDYRRKKLRDFGTLPYPMPFLRTKELVGFQRWVIGAYDKRISWAEFEKANYQPRNLNCQSMFAENELLKGVPIWK